MYWERNLAIVAASLAVSSTSLLADGNSMPLEETEEGVRHDVECAWILLDIIESSTEMDEANTQDALLAWWNVCSHMTPNGDSTVILESNPTGCGLPIDCGATAGGGNGEGGDSSHYPSIAKANAMSEAIAEAEAEAKAQLQCPAGCEEGPIACSSFVTSTDCGWLDPIILNGVHECGADAVATCVAACFSYEICGPYSYSYSVQTNPEPSQVRSEQK